MMWEIGVAMAGVGIFAYLIVEASITLVDYILMITY